MHADCFGNALTKFIVNNKANDWKPDVSLCFIITNCQIVRCRSLTHPINSKFKYLSAYWQWKLANERSARNFAVLQIIIWLAPWGGKMNQILYCNWLPEWARWSYLARSGLPVVSRTKNFPESHIVLKSFVDQACLAKMTGYWPRSFFASLWTEMELWSINTQKRITSKN